MRRWRRPCLSTYGSQGANFTVALAGSQLYGWTGTCLGGEPGTQIGNFGRPRAVASWSREAGDTVLVKTAGRTVARVSAEEHMANYQAARALMGKGRNAGEGAAGLSKSSAKTGAKKSAVKKAKPKK